MSILYVDNLEPNLGSRVMAAGHVVQVVQFSGANTTSISTTQNTYVSAAGTCSITPTSSTSKILITHSAGGLAQTTQSTKIRIKRDGTEIWKDDRYGYNSGSDWVPNPWKLTYLDSPFATSQVDYTFEIAQGSTGFLRHNDLDTSSNTWITILMEIAQ